MRAPEEEAHDEARRVYEKCSEDVRWAAFSIALDVAAGRATGGKNGKGAKRFRDARDREDIARAIYEETGKERWRGTELARAFPTRSVTTELQRVRDDDGQKRT